MKVAIPINENNEKNSTICEHFGKTPYFAFAEMLENGEYNLEIKENPLSQHEPGDIPKYIGEQKVNVMIVRGMGKRAVTFFEELNIEVISGADGTVEEILKSFIDNKLESVDYKVAQKFHDHSH